MKKIFWIVSFFCIIGCLLSAWHRHQLETTNRHVELVLDYDGFLDMCSRGGYPVTSTLSQFRAAGVTTVALSEITLEKLSSMGRVVLIRGEDLSLFPEARMIAPNAIKMRFPYVYVKIAETQTKLWLFNAFSSLLGVESVQEVPDGLVIRGRFDDLTQMGLGIFPEQSKFVTSQQFLISQRIENRDSLDLKKLDYLLDNMASTPNASVVIFTGLQNEVLGFDAFIPQVSKFFREHNVLFGFVEAYEKGRIQKGSEALAKILPLSTVKVQGLQIPLMTRVDPEKGVEMFSLGVKERNVRVIYYRPFLMNFNGKNLLQTNLDFLVSLKESLKRGDLEYGRATPFPIFHPTLMTLLASSFLVCAASMLLASSLFKVNWGYVILGSCGVLLVTALSYFTSMGEAWRLGLAFWAALVFPILGIVRFFPKLPQRFFKSVAILCQVTLVTTLGGLVVSSLLANNSTMLEITGFRGVKAILFLPVIGVWMVWVRQHFDQSSMSRLKDWLAYCTRPLKEPVRLAHLLILFALGAGGLLIILRSGNSAPEGTVPLWERSFRVFLENVLFVRPRFKEFLVGHPSFLLALLLGIEHPLGGFFLVLGSLSQGDIMDSFAHLHTPLVVTLLRTFNGLWIGVILGAFFRFIAKRAKNPATCRGVSE